jgi:hypothetical protein
MNATLHTALDFTSLKLIGVNPIGFVVAIIIILKITVNQCQL